LGVSPQHADEIDSPMLWWERVMQKEAKVSPEERSVWSNDVGLGVYYDEKSYGVLSPSAKARVLLWARARAAEACNMLGTARTPTQGRV
jgi:hypothetical protein